MKKFSKILAVLLGVMILSSTAFAATSSRWKMVGDTYVIPSVSTWEICASGNRCAKIWGTDIDLSGSITAGGIILTGNLNLGGNDIEEVDSIYGSTSILPVRIGDAATTSHSLASEDDLLVTGKMEVDGATYYDGVSTFYNNLNVRDAKILYFGNSDDSTIMYNTAQSPDALLTGVSGDSNNLLIVEAGDKTYDFAHAQQTNPTVFIQSANQSTDEWISFAHDQTNGNIEVGTGDVKFNSSILAGAYEFAEDAGFVSAMDMSVSATPTAGDQMSYTFKIDGESFLKMYSEADSAGGIQNENIRFFKDISTGANDLNITPAAGQITEIGDAGSTSHSLATNDDLFVSGKLEVDGLSYFDSVVTLINDIDLSLGSSSEIRMRYGTAQTPNSFVMNVPATSNGLILTTFANRLYDHAHALQTNPTLYIQSATQSATEWLSFAHDQTNAVLTSGAGAIQNVPASTFGVDFETSGAKATCDATTRGQLFVEEGGAGVTDTVYMCLKAVADTYSWISVTTGG